MRPKRDTIGKRYFVAVRGVSSEDREGLRDRANEAHSVMRELPKLKVAGSSPVARSKNQSS
jgi:hypothetical protein